MDRLLELIVICNHLTFLRPFSAFFFWTIYSWASTVKVLIKQGHVHSSYLLNMLGLHLRGMFLLNYLCDNAQMFFIEISYRETGYFRLWPETGIEQLGIILIKNHLCLLWQFLNGSWAMDELQDIITGGYWWRQLFWEKNPRFFVALPV